MLNKYYRCENPTQEIVGSTDAMEKKRKKEKKEGKKGIFSVTVCIEKQKLSPLELIPTS